MTKTMRPKNLPIPPTFPIQPGCTAAQFVSGMSIVWDSEWHATHSNAYSVAKALGLPRVGTDSQRDDKGKFGAVFECSDKARVIIGLEGNWCVERAIVRRARK